MAWARGPLARTTLVHAHACGGRYAAVCPVGFSPSSPARRDTCSVSRESPDKDESDRGPQPAAGAGCFSSFRCFAELCGGSVHSRHPSVAQRRRAGFVQHPFSASFTATTISSMVISPSPFLSPAEQWSLGV